MTHWQRAAVKTMASHTSHRAARETNQSGGNMVLRSGRTIKQKRLSNGSKVNQHLSFLCTCFKSNGKQRKEMIARANKGQIEAIGEIALNLLKGNILVPSSSFKRLKPYKTKLLYLTRKKPSLKKKKKRSPQSTRRFFTSSLLWPWIYWIKCWNETRSKDAACSGTIIPKYRDRTPINNSSAAYDVNTFGSRHEKYHGFFLTKRPKSDTISRAIKTNEERNDCKTYGGITNANASRNRDNSQGNATTVDIPGKDYKTTTEKTTCHTGRYDAVKNSRQHWNATFTPGTSRAWMDDGHTPDSVRKSVKRSYKARTPLVARLRSNRQWERY